MSAERAAVPSWEHGATPDSNTVFIAGQGLAQALLQNLPGPAPLLDQGHQAVPEHLPLRVHSPKHKQQMQRWVLPTALLLFLLLLAPQQEVSLAPRQLLFGFLSRSARAARGAPGDDAHGVVQPPSGQRGLKAQERPPLLPCRAKRGDHSINSALDSEKRCWSGAITVDQSAPLHSPKNQQREAAAAFGLVLVQPQGNDTDC